MRRLPAAVLVSVLGHTAALGWILWHREVLAVPLRERAARPPGEALTAPAPDEPISVVLLQARDAPAPAQRAPAPAPAAVATRSTEPTAPTRSTTGRAPPDRGAIPTGATAAAPPRDEPGRSRWMTMRGPERPPGGVSPGFVERFLRNSKPLAPPPDIPGERIADELAEARRQLRAGRGDLRKVVALAEQRAAEELTPSGGGTYRADKETFTAKVDPDGRVHLEDKPEALDTQDRLMLRMGIDPYARNKLAFLDRTRDQRAAVGERFRRVQLAHSAELMQRNVDRLWAIAGDVAARKLGLFELWDDCAETGSEEIVAGGAAARALVIGVIRARLVGGDAYTADELARLNARRRSTAMFAPYE